MNSKILKAALTGLILFVSCFANAGLILHISLDENTGTGTRWQLTGSAIAVSTSDNYKNSFWGVNIEDMVNSSSRAQSILTGGATLSSTSGGTQNVVDVWSSSNNLAPRVNYINWEAGDVLSWDGDFTSTLYFSTLRIGTYSTYEIGGTTLLDSLTIIVSNTPMVEVPEPSTLAIFALVLMGLASRRFKKH